MLPGRPEPTAAVSPSATTWLRTERFHVEHVIRAILSCPVFGYRARMSAVVSSVSVSRIGLPFMLLD